MRALRFTSRTRFHAWAARSISCLPCGIRAGLWHGFNWHTAWWQSGPKLLPACHWTSPCLKAKAEPWALQKHKLRVTDFYPHGDYRKFPKYLDTQTICCNHSKIWTMRLYHRVMSPNDADGMANSVDPDQTAPLGAVWSGSALFAQAYLSENSGSLRYYHIKL